MVTGASITNNFHVLENTANNHITEALDGSMDQTDTIQVTGELMLDTVNVQHGPILWCVLFREQTDNLRFQ